MLGRLWRSVSAGSVGCDADVMLELIAGFRVLKPQLVVQQALGSVLCSWLLVLQMLGGVA